MRKWKVRDRQKCKGGICRTGNVGPKSRGGKSGTEIAGVENAKVKNAGRDGA